MASSEACLANGDGEEGELISTSYGISAFKDRLKTAFLNKQLSPFDLRVWVSKGTTFRLHKDLFAMASPIFDSLLRNNATSAVASNGQFSVQLQMDKDVFKHVRKFLYTDELPQDLNMETVLKLMEASFQFCIDRLLGMTIALVQTRLSPEGAFKVLQAARAMECSELEELALEMIYCNTGQLMNNDDFIALGSYDVCRILSSDALRCSEVVVFKAAVRWAEGQAPQREDQNRALKLKYYFSQVEMCIRFPLMSAAEFASVTLNQNCFPHETIVKIFQYLCLPRAVRNAVSLNYVDRPRSYSLPQNTISTQTNFTPSLPIPSERSIPPPVPVASPKPHLRKRKISGLTESAQPTTSAAVETSPAKVMRTEVNQENEDSGSDELFTTIIVKKLENRAFPTYEEIVRKYAKEENKQVSRFEFSNVVLQNNYRNMMFPGSKDLQVDAQCSFFDKSNPLFLDFVSRFDPMRYIVFNTKSTVRMTAENIWSLNQNILLKFNGVTFLRVNHKEKENGSNGEDILVINYVPDSKKIMNNSKLKPKVLALSNCEISIKALKDRGKQVEKLILYKVWGDYTFEEIMKDFPNLKELMCWKYVPTNWIEGTNFTVPLCLNFSNTFAAKCNIRKLVLFQTELKFPARCSNIATSVTELILDHCHSTVGERNSHISDVFHMVFPALKTLIIMEQQQDGQKAKPGNIAIPSLINSVCKRIESIEWIMIGGMKWESDDNNENESVSTEFLSFLRDNTNLTGTPNNYRLLKAIGSNWEGISMDERADEPTDVDGGFWSERDEMEFHWYNLGYFYDSFELYEDYFKQAEDGFPKPILWT